MHAQLARVKLTAAAYYVNSCIYSTGLENQVKREALIMVDRQKRAKKIPARLQESVLTEVNSTKANLGGKYN